MITLTNSITNSDITTGTSEQFVNGLKELFNKTTDTTTVDTNLASIDIDTIKTNEIAKYEIVEIESTDEISRVKLTEHPNTKTKELYQYIFANGKKVFGIKKETKLVIVQPRDNSGAYITADNIDTAAKTLLISIITSNVNFQILKELNTLI